MILRQLFEALNKHPSLREFDIEGFRLGPGILTELFQGKEKGFRFKSHDTQLHDFEVAHFQEAFPGVEIDCSLQSVGFLFPLCMQSTLNLVYGKPPEYYWDESSFRYEAMFQSFFNARRAILTGAAQQNSDNEIVASEEHSVIMQVQTSQEEGPSLEELRRLLDPR